MSATQSLVDLLAAQSNVDSTGWFGKLWNITRELSEKLTARFELHPDGSTAPFAHYQSLDGEARGSLNTFYGPEIDWLVHSHIGNPKHSFTNMHFTVWLGPQIKTPHFGMAMGTMPDIFLYFDYVPRVDLMVDLDYLDKYYEPTNAKWREFQDNPEYRPFVSRSLYMRQSVSQVGFVYLVKPSDKAVSEIRELAHWMFDNWLRHVNEAPPTPASERAALAARDLHIRRAIAERDPANLVGEQLFGKEMADKLVRGLWGGDRLSERVM
ncbi:MAG: red chlorophyll catabolite reductase [Chloroflexi bacterium]|nr:red chlorophyll catabolite reductase [Chloroflexota bacterium]